MSDHETNQGQESLLRLQDVEARVALKRTAIYKMIALGLFPQPVKIDDESPAVRWVSSEIDAWIQSRIDARTK